MLELAKDRIQSQGFQSSKVKKARTKASTETKKSFA